MKAHEFNPRRLDIAAFAEAAGEFSGEFALSDLTRLSADQHESAQAPGAPVRWSARGEARPRRAAPPEIWLHLQARADVALQCQRCLQPALTVVTVERAFLFVATEALAAELDDTSEDDVLVLNRNFDLQELIEDELLLALPVVPRHDSCPQPLQFDSGDAAISDAAEAEAEERPHPFAALAALKRDPSGS